MNKQVLRALEAIEKDLSAPKGGALHLALLASPSLRVSFNGPPESHFDLSTSSEQASRIISAIEPEPNGELVDLSVLLVSAGVGVHSKDPDFESRLSQVSQIAGRINAMNRIVEDWRQISSAWLSAASTGGEMTALARMAIRLTDSGWDSVATRVPMACVNLLQMSAGERALRTDRIHVSVVVARSSDSVSEKEA